MSANRKMNAAMKGSLSCEDSGMEEYIMKLFGAMNIKDNELIIGGVKISELVEYINKNKK